MHVLEQLFRAAQEHAENNGDFDYQIGDLQIMMEAAWNVMTPAQRAEFFRDPLMVDLLEHDDYEDVTIQEDLT